MAVREVKCIPCAMGTRKGYAILQEKERTNILFRLNNTSLPLGGHLMSKSFLKFMFRQLSL